MIADGERDGLLGHYIDLDRDGGGLLCVGSTGAVFVRLDAVGPAGGSAAALGDLGNWALYPDRNVRDHRSSLLFPSYPAGFGQRRAGAGRRRWSATAAVDPHRIALSCRVDDCYFPRQRLRRRRD